MLWMLAEKGSGEMRSDMRLATRMFFCSEAALMMISAVCFKG